MNDHKRNFSELKKYYGPLIEHYVERILNSMELIDEDFEVTVDLYRRGKIFSESRKKKTGVSPIFYATTSSLLASIVSAKLIGPLYGVPPAILTTGLAFYYAYQHIKENKYEKLITELIIKLKGVQNLHVRIEKYLLETTFDVRKYSSVAARPFDNTLIVFLQTLLTKQIAFQQQMISNICSFTEFCDKLEEDCFVIEQLKTDREVKVSTIGVDLSITALGHKRLVQQLLNSKLLSYFAIVCGSDESIMTIERLQEVLNHKIPVIIKKVTDYLKNASQLFDSLQRTINKLLMIRNEKIGPKSEYFMVKVRNSLESSANNLGFVLEKLHNIIHLLDGYDNEPVDEDIFNTLKSLRSHTLDSSETINLLGQVYGLVSGREQKQHRESPLKFTETQNTNDVDSVQPSEKIEDKEIYDLYVEANEEVEVSQPVYEEPAMSTIRALGRDLKQELRKNDYYLYAEKRWMDGNAEEKCEECSEPVNSSDEDSGQALTVTENPSYACSSHSTLGTIRKKVDCSRVKRSNIFDTLTRAVETEQKEKWGNILQFIEKSKSKQSPEETFGEKEDSE